MKWDTYFLDLATSVSSKSTCSRAKHGAIVVQKHRIRGTGYNGGPRGYGHCEDGACPRARTDVPSGSSYDNCIAIHAEANALLWTAPEERDGAVLYVTGQPCFSCAKLIANSGIAEVVYGPGYTYATWPNTKSFLQQCGVLVRAA
jgi:deoxycytidylate deaminase